jgi:UDP:flavonoid glycosyltransferase YjiC (YdhE family)
MWKEGHMNAEHVRRGKNFDLIIEPSDIAESSAAAQIESPAFDKVKTDPIWLLDSDELLSREEARSVLGIPGDQRCCLIQLGSGTNRDIASLLSTIIPTLRQRRIVPYIAEWLMGSEVPRIWPGVVYMRLFPLSKYFRAFDFSISAAGYNSYHELLGFGVPTIFIANEHQMMDDQAARAQYAMRNDAAIWIAEEAVNQIASAIDLITQNEVCELMIAGCAALKRKNGALEAAQIVDTLATDVGLGRFNDRRPQSYPTILAA